MADKWNKTPAYDCAAPWGNYLQPHAVGPAALGNAGWGTWSSRYLAFVQLGEHEPGPSVFNSQVVHP
jgi:hypothetical protein